MFGTHIMGVSRINTCHERFNVEPFVTGIYSGNTHNMSAKHTLKLLWEAEQEYGSVIRGMTKKKKKSKAKMFNLPNGLSHLTNAFVK